jgi:hypothetical protein
MNAPISELEIVKGKITSTEADLENAKQANDRDLVLAYANMLNNLYQKEQRLENAGTVLNF